MTSPIPRGSPHRRPVLVPAVLLLAAGALGITAALGGLEAAPPERPPLLGAGDEVDQDLFRTKIDNAVVHSMGSDTDPQSPPRQVVLDLDLEVYNNAFSSVPLGYLQNSLLLVSSAQGEKLMVANPQAVLGIGGDKWLYDMAVPGEGVPSRLLPPKTTSKVLLRIRRREPDGNAQRSDEYPDRVDLDIGLYENHKDSLTGRHTAELVKGDDGKPLVVAQVSVPVRKAA
jgi:hypothetical protein